MKLSKLSVLSLVLTAILSSFSMVGLAEEGITIQPPSAEGMQPASESTSNEEVILNADDESTTLPSSDEIMTDE
ncbi:MAG: hypothetical protein H6622_00165 [Halobacteriovoraceae bacterium]|nr:hypothetical protein [Halobacteriovoraceae bacterium]